MGVAIVKIEMMNNFVQIKWLKKGIVLVYRGDHLLSDIEHFLCKYRLPSRVWSLQHFKLHRMIKSSGNQVKNIENTMFLSSSTNQMIHKQQSRCHRGLDVRVWSNNQSNLTTNTCLCPPSFYGDQCQYQNQRVSLTIKFRALAGSWQTVFAIVILFIDNSDQRIIHSYEQFTFFYLSEISKRNLTYIYSIQLARKIHLKRIPSISMSIKKTH